MSEYPKWIDEAAQSYLWVPAMTGGSVALAEHFAKHWARANKLEIATDAFKEAYRVGGTDRDTIMEAMKAAEGRLT